MKRALTVLLCTVFVASGYIAGATTYYFSSSLGNDSRTSMQAKNPLTPWRSISKLNNTTLQPGDSLLFKRGDTFYGSIQVDNSGSSGNPIVFSTYGTGAKPIITGLTTVNAWVNTDRNIWESASSVSSLSYTNMVVINGVNTAMGRYPNKEYLTYENFSGDNSITSKGLSRNPDWTGAELVLRKNHYIIDRDTIKSQSGNTLNYSSSSTYSNTNGYGFFIQNDIRTLDTVNEWYFNPSTKKLSIYGTRSPTDVKVSTIDTLIQAIDKSYITFDGISFKGSNKSSLYFYNSTNIDIKNCNFNFSGTNAISAYLSTYFNVKGCSFNNTNNNAITFTSWSYKPLPTHHISISEDTIKNTAMLAGMGKKTDGQGERCAIYLKGSNSIIKNCVIDNTGYIPIWWAGNSFIVKNNFITNFCFIKDDGGGIWTWNNGSNPSVYTKQKVVNNIILNGIGALQGSVPEKFSSASGIYCDNNTSNIEISGNTVANCNANGILLHDAHEISVKNNTLYNNAYQITLYSDDNHTDNSDGVSYIRNIDIKNNILFSGTSKQKGLAIVSFFNDISHYGNMDSNYYASPLDNNYIINTITKRLPTQSFTLEEWRKKYNYDMHSNKVTTTKLTRFEYNASPTPKSMKLGSSYMDAREAIYNGTIKLQPYTSAVLIRKAISNQPPNADAGPDQTIVLPNNTVQLSGSGIDPDGTVSSYFWEKIAGPSAATISNVESAITSVTKLVKGVYKFELKITDNSGVSVWDTMQVTVNPFPNKLPVAEVKNRNVIITLPNDSITLVGSKSNAGYGKITSYQWKQKSGSSSSLIVDANSAETKVKGLRAGLHKFQLTVTDNDGTTSSTEVKVTANPAPNKPPIAEVENDNITTTLPDNSVSLDGSSSKDSDGKIVSYQWEQKSGPSNSYITNKSSVQTSVNSLQSGTYIFQLTVKDNDNATSTAEVKVAVNPAPNKPPVAEVKNDQLTITLPDNSVILDGSSSKDSDGKIVSYQWEQKSGPSSSNITNKSSAKTSVNNLRTGTYTFQLTVRDNDGATSSAEVNVTVNPAPNKSPVAEVKNDNITTTLPDNSISLDGSSSKDSDGKIVSYQWRQKSGPSSSLIVDANSVQTSVNNLQAGTYTLQLTVKDNDGATSTAAVKVLVNPAPNKLPIAEVKNDQLTITLPDNSVILDGSSSKDSDGKIVSYQWKQKSGSSNSLIVDANSAQASVNSLQVGTYIFQLTVTDNDGGTSSAEVKVTVNPAPNKPPVADVEENQLTTTLPDNSVTLDGSSSKDSDGKIVSYQWKQKSGPSNSLIVDANSAKTKVKGLRAGLYKFQLTVTDNDGATSTVEVKVTVNPAPNKPPIAEVKNDNIKITLPDNSISLDGSSSKDSDGKIVSYQWKQKSGSSNSLIVDANSAQASVNSLQVGTYIFQLTVTDNDGGTSSTEVKATVNPAPNKPPVAKAKNDQLTITLPGGSVLLDGGGSGDSDGKITSYQWEQKSGPSNSLIVDNNSAETEVKSLRAGLYKFQLTVTDNDGATSIAEVKVMVNPAPNKPPVAEVKNDHITTTLPDNSISLDGSSSKDSDGKVVSYQWKQKSGPLNPNITNKSSAQTSVNRLQTGTYVFQLTVKDDDGATSSAEVKVTVNPAPNKPPVAEVENDNITITLPDNSISIDGSSSKDNDGKIVSYQWKQKSGPLNPNITNISSAQTSVNRLQTGTYIFLLTVKDKDGATSSAEVKVTVNPAPNKPPAAEVKESQLTITLPDNSISLDGSSSKDSDGKIVSYQWKQKSGPSHSLIMDANSAETEVTDLRAGLYKFQLTVTDNDGATSSAEVKVTVKPDTIIGSGSSNQNEEDTVSLTESAAPQLVLLYPNPASNFTNIRLRNHYTGRIQVIIYDIYGVVIQKRSCIKDKEYFEHRIYINNFASAVYFIQIQIGNYSITRKLIVIE